MMTANLAVQMMTSQSRNQNLKTNKRYKANNVRLKLKKTAKAETTASTVVQMTHLANRSATNLRFPILITSRISSTRDKNRFRMIVVKMRMNSHIQ